MKKRDVQRKIVSILVADNGRQTQKKVAEKLNVSLSNLTYHWKDLRINQVIYPRGELWFVNNHKALSYFDETPVSAKISKNGSAKDCRSHAYGIKLIIPFELDKQTRERICLKLGFTKSAKPASRTELIGAWWHQNEYLTEFFLANWRVQISANSVYALLRKDVSFHSEDAFSNDLAAIDDWMNNVVKRLENILGKKLHSQNANYPFKLQSKHHARVNNAIAKLLKQQGKEPLRIYSAEGYLWYITDDSFGNNEAECIYGKTATTDDQKVTGWFNGLKEYNEIITPNDVMQTIAATNEMVMQNTKNMTYYGENIVSHVKAIQQLGDGVQKLSHLMDSGQFQKKMDSPSETMQQLKDKINTYEDVLKYKEEIEAIHKNEKYEFSVWLSEKLN